MKMFTHSMRPCREEPVSQVSIWVGGGGGGGGDVLRCCCPPLELKDWLDCA